MSTETMTFEQIVGQIELTEDLRTAPEEGRITVMVDMPHLPQFGHDSTRELVYGCNFAVAVGDKVLCPPTKLYPHWMTGIVVALDGRGYKGPVKAVRKYKTNDEELF